MTHIVHLAVMNVRSILVRNMYINVWRSPITQLSQVQGWSGTLKLGTTTETERRINLLIGTKCDLIIVYQPTKSAKKATVCVHCQCTVSELYAWWKQDPFIDQANSLAAFFHRFKVGGATGTGSFKRQLLFSPKNLHLYPLIPLCLRRIK
jgi:hypothetical protein